MSTNSPSGSAHSAAGADTDPRLLLLAPDDNVLVVTVRIRGGTSIRVSGGEVAVPADLPLGHKVARRHIRPGEKILKYGAPIGSATAEIAPGAHVHLHNVKSDYTPTYHLEDAKAQFAGGE